MKALVVYESMFGNTEQVAQSIADGLSRHSHVELLEVTQAREAMTEPLDLLVIGGPTHALSMSRPSTRQDAVRQGATQGSTSFGLREWLENLRRGRCFEFVATFDTRVSRVRHLPGSAAKAAAKIASGLGYSSAAQAESFYVEDVSGPLLEGELDRAREWGEWLGRQSATLAVHRATPGR